MYIVLFPSGRTEFFQIRELAETYVLAYRGVMISAPVIPTLVEGYLQEMPLR
jgi:hypothetical protein